MAGETAVIEEEIEMTGTKTEMMMAVGIGMITGGMTMMTGSETEDEKTGMEITITTIGIETKTEMAQRDEMETTDSLGIIMAEEATTITKKA